MPFLKGSRRQTRPSRARWFRLSEIVGMYQSLWLILKLSDSRVKLSSATQVHQDSRFRLPIARRSYEPENCPFLLNVRHSSSGCEKCALAGLSWSVPVVLFWRCTYSGCSRGNLLNIIRSLLLWFILNLSSYQGYLSPCTACNAWRTLCTAELQ